ncbi:hypothetical protein BWI17_17915 [Betaproteobacteria bacterium GR16-43]|nr:hypothetical protein BWI17_17915 [Betaproteobacteria bacterium GR16-43]
MSASFDQAQGLRELFARPALSILPVVSGAHGVGKTTVVTHLAHAAARAGRRVAILDASRGDVAAACGIAARYELMHMLEGLRGWEDVAIAGPGGVRIVPGARGYAAMSRDPAQGAQLFPAFASLENGPELLLVNLPSGEALTSSLLDPDGDILLVLTPRPESLTAAYAVVKRLARETGTRRIRLLVNRAATPDEARQVHATFAAAAQRFLAIAPEFAGFVGNDPAVGVARRAKRTAFDSEPLCGAATSFLRIAQAIDGWTLARSEAPAP